MFKFGFVEVINRKHDYFLDLVDSISISVLQDWGGPSIRKDDGGLGDKALAHTIIFSFSKWVLHEPSVSSYPLD